MQIESWCVAYLSEGGQENSGLIGSSRSLLRLARQRTLLYLRSDLKDALVSLEYYTQIYSFHFIITSFKLTTQTLPLTSLKEKCLPVLPRKFEKDLQKDKFGTSDSVDEDESSGFSLTEFETLQLCTPTGDIERRREGKAEVTNETMTEDVATPHGDDITDDPVLPDSEAEDELVPGTRDRTKPLPPYPQATATECVVVISWEILVTTLAVHQVFK